MGQERRSDARKLVLLEAKWESMSRTHEARVDDISLGGCFVNTYGRVELGEEVQLQILRPAGAWLRLNGNVVSYQQGVGFGMAFTSLTNEKKTALQELMLSAEERKL
jgi:hypothetical protein